MTLIKILEFKFSKSCLTAVISCFNSCSNLLKLSSWNLADHNSARQGVIKYHIQYFLFIFIATIGKSIPLFNCKKWRFSLFWMQIVELSFLIKMQIFFKISLQIVDRKAKNGVIYIYSDPPFFNQAQIQHIPNTYGSS